MDDLDFPVEHAPPKSSSPARDGDDETNTDTDKRLTLHRLARKLAEIQYRVVRIERMLRFDNNEWMPVDPPLDEPHVSEA